MTGILDRGIEATESFGRQAYFNFNRRIYYDIITFLQRRGVLP